MAKLRNGSLSAEMILHELHNSVKGDYPITIPQIILFRLDYDKDSNPLDSVQFHDPNGYEFVIINTWCDLSVWIDSKPIYCVVLREVDSWKFSQMAFDPPTLIIETICSKDMIFNLREKLDLWIEAYSRNLSSLSPISASSIVSNIDSSDITYSLGPRGMLLRHCNKLKQPMTIRSEIIITYRSTKVGVFLNSQAYSSTNSGHIVMSHDSIHNLTPLLKKPETRDFMLFWRVTVPDRLAVYELLVTLGQAAFGIVLPHMKDVYVDGNVAYRGEGENKVLIDMVPFPTYPPDQIRCTSKVIMAKLGNSRIFGNPRIYGYVFPVHCFQNLSDISDIYSPNLTFCASKFHKRHMLYVSRNLVPLGTILWRRLFPQKVRSPTLINNKSYILHSIGPLVDLNHDYLDEAYVMTQSKSGFIVLPELVRGSSNSCVRYIQPFHGSRESNTGSLRHTDIFPPGHDISGHMAAIVNSPLSLSLPALLEISSQLENASYTKGGDGTSTPCFHTASEYLCGAVLGLEGYVQDSPPYAYINFRIAVRVLKPHISPIEMERIISFTKLAIDVRPRKPRLNSILDYL